MAGILTPFAADETHPQHGRSSFLSLFDSKLLLRLRPSVLLLPKRFFPDECCCCSAVQRLHTQVKSVGHSRMQVSIQRLAPSARALQPYGMSEETQCMLFALCNRFMLCNKLRKHLICEKTNASSPETYQAFACRTDKLKTNVSLRGSQLFQRKSPKQSEASQQHAADLPRYRHNLKTLSANVLGVYAPEMLLIKTAVVPVSLFLQPKGTTKQLNDFCNCALQVKRRCQP